MAEEDRVRWDAAYSSDGDSEVLEPRAPSLFARYEHLFPTEGFALDLACGTGSTSVWLASRGLEVVGVDISSEALYRARRLAADNDVSDRCTFVLSDLDDGLPSSPPADVIVCNMFRDQRLYRPIVERLKSGGLLAIAVLSEVGAEPGRFRARAGELMSGFESLSVIAGGEGDGRAWILAYGRPGWK
jgi:SAM-dependent methyltransferase